MRNYVKRDELVAAFPGPEKNGRLRGYHRIGAYMGVCHATARRWALSECQFIIFLTFTSRRIRLNLTDG
jgi:hypothetical protein